MALRRLSGVSLTEAAVGLGTKDRFLLKPCRPIIMSTVGK